MIDIKTLFNKLLLSLGIAPKYFEKSKENPILVSNKNNNTDLKKIQELLTVKYKDKVLESFEEELKLAYDQYKAHEITLVPHSEKHHAIIDAIQQINRDLEKVQRERKLSDNNTEIMLNKIKQDLGISNYNLKKQK